ncbi:MAG: hypothetical protein KGM47_15565, partial [Acidobacteriota bacterium]|nr:hypothetical protein [Acidobacteriota bacterium]
LVEKLKQFDKQVFVIGGRAFTSNILQKNCTEFIAYENLLRSESGRGRPSRRGEAASRASQEPHALSESLPNIQRALKILADRGVAPQLGLLKSTLLQLDSTFTERDYGAGSFLEFMQKVEREGFARLHRTDRGYLVEMADSAGEAKAAPPAGEPPAETETTAAVESAGEGAAQEADPMALEILKQALAAAFEKAPGRPLYLRQIRQRLRAAVRDFDERKYGYKGTLDLLHHAQREGLLKLQRDHKGIWRIYQASPPPVAEMTGATPGAAMAAAEAIASTELEDFVLAAPAEPLAESERQETFVAAWDAPAEIPSADAAANQGAEAPAEPVAAEKARKPRSSKAASTKGTRRKGASRKKKPAEAAAE